MTKADELWEKYSDDTGYKRRKMCEAGFLAALKEYGQHIGEAVRKRDVEICREQEILHQSTDQKAAIRFVGYAIEREPLP